MRFLSRRRPKEIYGWIAYLDIFGYRAHLDYDFFPNSEEQLLRLHETLRADKNFSAASTYFMFSDSVALWSEAGKSDEKQLRAFIDRVAITERTAANFGFLLRGSVAYGRILLSPTYILGNAYLRAYTYEAYNLFQPIVVIPAKELETASLQHLFERTLATIKLKNGTEDTALVLDFVPWDQIRDIKAKSIAAIMSSASPKKDDLVARWEAIDERRT